MNMQTGQKGGLWSYLSNNLTAQIIIGVVVAAVLITLAAKYIW